MKPAGLRGLPIVAASAEARLRQEPKDRAAKKSKAVVDDDWLEALHAPPEKPRPGGRSARDGGDAVKAEGAHPAPGAKQSCRAPGRAEAGAALEGPGGARATEASAGPAVAPGTFAALLAAPVTPAPPREKVPSEGLEPRTTGVQRSPPREPPPGVDGVAGQALASGALAVLGTTPPAAASGPGDAASPALAAEAPHPTAPPPPLGEAARTLLLLAMTDVSLGVDVHQQVVNVVLQTEAAGPLELELRLHEGRAHLTVEGPGSPLLAQHAPALREVLSREGLSLGEFSTPQGDRPRQEEREDEAAGPSPASVSAPSPRRRHEGRIDVEA